MCVWRWYRPQLLCGGVLLDLLRWSIYREKVILLVGCIALTGTGGGVLYMGWDVFCNILLWDGGAAVIVAVTGTVMVQ